MTWWERLNEWWLKYLHETGECEPGTLRNPKCEHCFQEKANAEYDSMFNVAEVEDVQSG